MKIVILDGYTLNPGDLSWAALNKLGDVTIYDRTPENLIVERARDADAVLTNKTPLRTETLQHLTQLRYIGVLATGYDVVDVKAAKENGIYVTNVPSYGTHSVAQMVFALLLELSQHVGSHSEAVKGGEWSESEDWCFWNAPLTELADKTIGIVGYGRIGEQVARIAHAFGMKVIANRRTKSDEFPFPNFKWVDLPELWQQSDVITLHCPLTAETEGMINKQTLTTMKRSAFLINTARGKLIAERDLADALNQGVIAGAALDVLSSEPPTVDNPLLQANRCIITPHIAWATREARNRLLHVAVKNVEAFMADKPVNVVNL